MPPTCASPLDPAAISRCACWADGTFTNQRGSLERSPLFTWVHRLVYVWPMSKETPTVRRATHVVLLDGSGRVLAVRFAYRGRSWWCAPARRRSGEWRDPRGRREAENCRRDGLRSRRARALDLLASARRGCLVACDVGLSRNWRFPLKSSRPPLASSGEAAGRAWYSRSPPAHRRITRRPSATLSRHEHAPLLHQRY